MAKKVRAADLRRRCPPPPAGVIEYLAHYRDAADRGAQRNYGPVTAETYTYVQQQRAYWRNVRQGLDWVIGHARRSMGARRPRR